MANIMVYNHAYRFTHFSEKEIERTNAAESLSLKEKLSTLAFGIKVPKPKNQQLPEDSFETHILKSHENIEIWRIPIQFPRGIVILFHGYSSSKASMLPYAKQFRNMGYETILVDFMGSGGSSGYNTTIGYKEAHDVKMVYEFVKRQYPQQKIVLFGTSMGAVAVMKSMEKYVLKPDKIILECPFGSMVTTTKKRFNAMGLPGSPFAEWLLFYGSIQNGFNAFRHKPTNYAILIKTPTLLLYGAKDKRVTKKETEGIYDNLSGPKKLIIFENAGHENYLNKYSIEWNEAVGEFLKTEH